MSKNQNLAITAVFILLAAGCTKKVAVEDYLFESPETYDSLVEEGWALFEGGNIIFAINTFGVAVERDASRPASYLGLGWSYARIQNLEISVIAFQAAVTFAENDATSGQQIGVEAIAGLAAVAIAAQEYEDAVYYSTLVIDEDPAFVFSHDVSFTISDILLLRAESYFYLDLITDAYLQIQAMDGNLIQDVITDTTLCAAMVNSETALNGIAEVILPDAARALINVSSVQDTSAGVIYGLVEVITGTPTLIVEGSPPLEQGQQVEVIYEYVEDYGKFINDLLAKLNDLKIAS